MKVKIILFFILLISSNNAFSQYFEFEVLDQNNIQHSINPVSYNFNNGDRIMSFLVDGEFCEGETFSIKNLSGTITPNQPQAIIRNGTNWTVDWGKLFPQGGSYSTTNLYGTLNQLWLGPSPYVLYSQTWPIASSINVTIPIGTSEAYPPSRALSLGLTNNQVAYTLHMAVDLGVNNWFGLSNTSTGCRNNIRLVFKVNKAPVPMDNIYICAGEDVSGNFDSSYTYSNWSPNNPINNPPNTTTTYTVDVSNGQCSVQDKFLISVYQPPQPIFPEYVCSIDLPLTYQIDTNKDKTIKINGQIVFDQGLNYTPSIQLNSSGSYSIVHEYFVNGPETCSNSYNINIVDQESVDLGEDITVCKGDSFPLLSINQNLKLPSTSISWTQNSNRISSADQQTTLTTSAPGIYCVNVTNSDLPNCNKSDCVEISEVDCDDCDIVPEINFSTSKCTLDFELGKLTNTTHIVGFQWDFGNGVVLNNINNGTQIYKKPGIYIVKLIVFGRSLNGNCCTKIIEKKIEIICEPDLCEIDKKPNWGYNKINRRKIQFNNYTSFLNGTQEIGYYWDFGDGTFSTEKDPVHVFAKGGTYNVCLTAYGSSLTGNCCEKKRCSQIVIKNCFLDVFTKKTIEPTGSQR